MMIEEGKIWYLVLYRCDITIGSGKLAIIH
jgi:hypothetical protein